MTRVGFIGLGIMGAPMVAHLRGAGYPVSVYNRSRAKADRFLALGCPVADSPRTLAAEGDIFITVVTDPAAVHAVTEGGDGLFAGSVAGKLLINMSTLSVQATQALDARAERAGMGFLDCPIVGSKAQVEAKQLIILAGGSTTLVDRVRPLLLTMAKTVIPTGPIGSGTALKLCMNLIVAQMTTALCEAMTLAKAVGLDPQRIFEVLHESPALNAGYFRLKELALMHEDFHPAFSLKNMLKDIRFMNAEARQGGIALPVTQAVQALMEQSDREGRGDEDLTTIVKSLGKGT